MFEHEPIAVMLCCNDPDTGGFAGKLFALEVGENLNFHGSVDVGEGPALQICVSGDLSFIAISGRQFPILPEFQDHVGNWCWCRVVMPGAAVLDLLNWPDLREHFSLFEAEIRLSNLWRAGGPFTDSDLRLIAKRF